MSSYGWSLMQPVSNHALMQRGFSLVELSIVLVILGLLTGGILAGQSLIRAAELRSVSSDISRYTTAVYAFRDRYFALPGDFNNAKAFWTNCTDHTNNNCNGDGDGVFEHDVCASGNSSEINRAWQHLALAGLVEGDYSTALNANCSGPSVTAPYNGIPGATVPRLRLSNGGIMFYRGLSLYGIDENVLNIGGYNATNSLEGGIFKPEESWNIDTKLDDGLSSSGAVRAFNTVTPTCIVAGAYNLASSGVECRMARALR